MRIVDLFCGIGGVAEAARSLPCRDEAQSRVVEAIDIDLRVMPIYAANHGITPQCQTLESIREVSDADLWWLSPPCQPYTSRGRGLRERDGRSQALEHLIGLIDRNRPSMVGVENVPAFADSAHHRRLVQTLENGGYSIRGDVLCPTQWGVPMRRRRFYLLARRDAMEIPLADSDTADSDSRNPMCRSLAEYLDEHAWSDTTLHVSTQVYQRYRSAINVVDVDDRSATTACFTSAYGASPVQAGSYVRCRRRGILRRFSAAEITRLMGFRVEFQWPRELGQRARYQLLGNSLSVTVVRALLRSLQHS
jgi:site-specific DNA-cytosine methylase